MLKDEPPKDTTIFFKDKHASSLPPKKENKFMDEESVLINPDIAEVNSMRQSRNNSLKHSLSKAGTNKTSQNRQSGQRLARKSPFDM